MDVFGKLYELDLPGFPGESREKVRNWKMLNPEKPGKAGEKPGTRLNREKHDNFNHNEDSEFLDFPGKTGGNPETGILKVWLLLEKPGKA